MFLWVDENKLNALKKHIFLSISSLLDVVECAYLPKCRSRESGRNNVNRYFQVIFFSLSVAFLRKNVE